jgi:hypothetical protein
LGILIAILALTLLEERFGIPSESDLSISGSSTEPPKPQPEESDVAPVKEHPFDAPPDQPRSPAPGPHPEPAPPEPAPRDPIHDKAAINKAEELLREGDIEGALAKLTGILQSNDRNVRISAQKMANEIEFATSSTEAQKLLETLSDEDLEGTAKGLMELEVYRDFTYPALRERFHQTLMENVDIVLQRRATR